MSFPSAAGVAILIVVILVVARFVPLRTRRAKERSSRQNEERFSSTLRVLSDGQVRELDGRGKKMKSKKRKTIKMATQSTRLDAKAIAGIRAVRHAAVRRRRALVLCLLVITAVTLVAGALAHFSFFYALIPFALFIMVIGLGVRASKKAREWEARVAAPVASKAMTSSQSVIRKAADHKSGNVRQIDNAGDGDGFVDIAVDASDVPTYVIPVAKIREVMPKAIEVSKSVDVSKASATQKSTGFAQQSEFISFSLGDSAKKANERQKNRSGDAGNKRAGQEEEVLSLEIRSQRQVAKAVPVPATSVVAVPTPAVAAQSVSVPALTEDSLGADVDAVLQRRRR